MPRWRGGWLSPGLEISEGFKLFRNGSQVPTPSEEFVFVALGLDWVRPEDRRQEGIL
jgi:hypothetical protein